jgi:tetratricopeptide (TPR) repeat protein
MSFVEYDRSSDRYHLHELIRLFADAQLRPSVRHQLNRRFARYVRTVLYAQPWIPGAEAVPRDARGRLALEWPNIHQVYRWAMAKPDGDASAARFLATFQWSRSLLSPVDRSGRLQWMLSGTRRTNSRSQRRLAAMNIVRKAQYHAMAREFREALHELGRLPAYIETLSDILDLLLQTLQLIATGDSEARDIILAFLTPFARSESSSLDQAQLLATVATIYGDMGNHGDAVAYFDRAMTMARATDARDQLAISLPAFACLEALANNDFDLAAAHADDLLRVANADDRRMTTVLLGRLAPVLAAKGDIARSDQLHDLYVARSRDLTFLPEDSRTLTNTAKVWYSLAFLGIAPGRKAKQYEERAIELLTEARRAARERSDSEEEDYAKVPLGLLYIARKSFARAKVLLPATLYREVTRHGGRSLRDALIKVFSEIQP